MDERGKRISQAEAILGGYPRFTRDTLVPLLLYKSVFVGDWFTELVSRERDASARRALEQMSRETLREALELLAAMRTWDAGQASPESAEGSLETLQRLILNDLMVLKEGSTEAIVLAAMRAPTEELRLRLLQLADLDRAHADELRTLLGRQGVQESLDRARHVRAPAAVGAHAGRAETGTLGQNVKTHLAQLRDAGETPVRLVLSHVSLRHLRDEGQVRPDHTAFGLPVDVDLGWEGECYAFLTDGRVRLAEITALVEARVSEGEPPG